MLLFIPPQLYTQIYYHILLLVLLGLVIQLISTDIQNMKSIGAVSLIGYLLFVGVTLYLGLRPNPRAYGDSYFYGHSFEMQRLGLVQYRSSDWAFSAFLKFSTNTMTLEQFFLAIDIIYVVPCFIFSKKYFKAYWFYAFFMFVGSFSFFSYGTNGLRNGMATALFIFALCFYERKWLMFIIMYVAIGIHASILIPLVGFVVALFYSNTKYILIAWLCFIPLSLVSGGVWESLFSGFIDDGRSAYLGQGNIDTQTVRGFRWDFILYSAMGIFAGYYFIIKEKFTEKFYVHLYNTFVIANGFWILVIRANYSNRIAYLSWFLMAPVIIYPMVKMKFWKNQNVVLASVISIYYLFTYFMLVIKG